MRAVGVLTIGQAPRADIGPVFDRHFAGSGIQVVERGALDHLSDEAIAAELAPYGEETTYVTMLRSGRSVLLAKARIVPLLQRQIDSLEGSCEAIVVVCTGDFPTLTSAVELFFPDRMLVDEARRRGISRHLGLVVPLARQADDIAAKWRIPGLAVHTAAATPYGESDLAAAARDLAEAPVELIVLDCFGYTAAHGEIAADATGVETLVPQEFVPETVARLFTKRESAR